MNACVRAVVRTAIHRGHQVVGIKRGYQGLLNGEFYIGEHGEPLMSLDSVSGWIKYGGAFLNSSRSEEFRSEAGRQQAAHVLRQQGIDAIIPIGGDGTFAGAIKLAELWEGQIVGCPGTIDNDLQGTDYTIGFATAVETAVHAIDNISDTAASHDRMFLIEVMGRHSGFIGTYAALASGAEAVAIPETPTDIPKIVDHLKRLKARGKNSAMMVVSEGDESGDVKHIEQLLIEADCPYKTRIVVLGHLQRGGMPSPEDRRRATQMGNAAVHAVLNGQSGIMIGTSGNQIVQCSFEEAIADHHPIPLHLLQLMDEMAS